jgi:sulfatase maturation enzyme AslB (radical SAM superfamily)
MKRSNLFRAFGRILTGYYPTLSIEITRECPLSCPGCYAYEPEHLGDAGPLRTLADFKGQALIDRVLDLVDHYRPLHVSIVGGEPLVRFRELDVLLPQLSAMGLSTQVVTSAVRQIPPAWANIKELDIDVSIDGLQPDHDVRRRPATYERIINNIKGHSITVHCTITRQMTARPDYFEQFLTFWSARAEVKRIWFSLFTPQRDAEDQEILSQAERQQVLENLGNLVPHFSKMRLPRSVIANYQNPPKSPSECLFARTTLSLAPDLKTRITPCQFGGDPDCSQCGCFASAGLKVVSDYRIMGFVPVSTIYKVSDAIGKKLGANSLS